LEELYCHISGKIATTFQLQCCPSKSLRSEQQNPVTFRLSTYKVVHRRVVEGGVGGSGVVGSVGEGGCGWRGIGPSADQ